MPTEKQHSNKAEYNEVFFQKTKKDYQDWALTGLFYSALHYVDAFLLKKGHSVEDHKTRFRYVRAVSGLKNLYAEYRALYDYSVNARYKMKDFTVSDLDDVHKKYYSPIKKEILRLEEKIISTQNIQDRTLPIIELY